MENQVQEVIQEFGGKASWEDKYKYLIQIGKELPPLSKEWKTDEYKVKGCQSQVWLHAEFGENGKIFFEAESDALIVSGLIALLLRIYSGKAPEEILKISPDFIKHLGLDVHLSPSRANGLVAMIRQIQYYAMAFQTLKNKG